MGWRRSPRTCSTRATTGQAGSRTSRSPINAGTAFPGELDPSIDVQNGWVHVLYKDDQNTGDATPKTDRYRYVRNGTQFDYTSFGASITVMQPAAGQNEAGIPAGIAVNPEGSDHHILAMPPSSSWRFVAHEWRPATTSWTNGTCGSHLTYGVGEWGSVPNDNLHVSVAKRKMARETTSAYCWYNRDASAFPTPPLVPDQVNCSTDDGILPGNFGPRPYRRSIGTRGDYGSDTTFCATCTEGLGSSVTLTNGSRTVTGSGTQWRTANRGPGDAFRAQGTGTFIVVEVVSDTELVLEQPVSTSGAGLAYSLRRQETTPQAWANCVAQSPSGVCRFYDGASASLVADNRVEIGYAYDDSPFLHSTSGNGAGLPVLRIDGTTTSATRNITLTAVGPNRHHGLPGTGVVLDAESSTGGGLWIFDDHVTVEWLEIKGGNGVDVYQASNANLLLATHIIHHTGGHGVYLDPTPLAWLGQVNVLNNTVSAAGGGSASCFKGVGGVGSGFSRVLVANNIGYTLDGGPALKFDFPDADPADGWADVSAHSRRNISSDASANNVNRTDPGVPVNGGTVNFVDNNVGVGNYHLNAMNVCAGCSIDLGADMSAFMAPVDIDGQLRPLGAAWDIGADEFGTPTAVRLMSFAAVPGDGAVVLEWRTGSELDNLGFHLYRGPSAEGPWTRLTSSLIPGLGSSAIGQVYSWLDGGLMNGVTYFYRLEDVDTASESTFHGPVSATPVAVSAPPPPEGGGGEPGGGSGGDGGGGGVDRLSRGTRRDGFLVARRDRRSSE